MSSPCPFASTFPCPPKILHRSPLFACSKNFQNVQPSVFRHVRYPPKAPTPSRFYDHNHFCCAINCTTDVVTPPTSVQPNLPTLRTSCGWLLNTFSPLWSILFIQTPQIGAAGVKGLSFCRHKHSIYLSKMKAHIVWILRVSDQKKKFRKRKEGLGKLEGLFSN